MGNLEVLENHGNFAENIYVIDENIVEKLSHRSKKNSLSENSKATYRTIIRSYNKFLAQNGLHVSEHSLFRYFDELKVKHKPATLNTKKYALLKIIKTQLGDDSILKTMAIEKVFEKIPSYETNQAISRDEVLSESEVELIILASQSKKTELILCFLWKTGCRVSEMINVRLTDCEPVKKHIKVGIIGKGNKERKVYIPSELYSNICNEYQGTFYLFESRTGKQLHRRNVFEQVKNAGKKAEYHKLHPHMLRHARATDLLLNKAVSLKAVSKYLGHASTATTADMYIHDDFSVTDILSQDSF